MVVIIILFLRFSAAFNIKLIIIKKNGILISSATSSSFDWDLLIKKIFSPSLAKISAYAFPIPSVHPVTTVIKRLL